MIAAIVAGTTLRGIVTLKVRRKIGASELTLHLLGTETTMVHKRRNTKKEERNIARAVMILNEGIRHSGLNRREIARGKYEIPFEFVLPSSLPATTQFPRVDTKGFNGRIKYVLQAKLADVIEEYEFKLDSTPLPSDIVPCIAQPTTHELKSFGYLNKGFLSVGASVENSRVGRGKPLRVSVASRNDASVDVHRVRIKLVEIIEYHALGEKASFKIELGKLKDIDLPGLDKSKSSSMEVRRSIRMGFNTEETYQSIYQDLVAANNQVDVIVPEMARDTYNGNLMKVSHYLKVTFFTQALVENPSTKIPIVIGNARRDSEQRLPPRSSSTTQPSPLNPHAPITHQRSQDEPIATVIVDEELDEFATGPVSNVEVGSRANDDDGVPMVGAILLDENNTRLGMEIPVDPRGSGSSNADPNSEPPIVHLGTENVIVCDIDEDDDDNEHVDPASIPEARMPRSAAGLATSTRVLRPPPDTGPVASAPEESLLNTATRECRARNDESTNVFRSGPGSPPGQASSSQQQDDGYSPFRMYSQQQQRRVCQDYSYDDSDFTSIITESDHRTARDQGLLDRLVQELNGSIHDYQVIATKLKIGGYQEIFQTLTPKELARIIQNISMDHQVRVACLLAKQISKNQNNHVICAHCAAAVSSTSEYFRSNMVEALLPFISDFNAHRNLIEEELSEWELIITRHAMQDAATGRI